MGELSRDTSFSTDELLAVTGGVLCGGSSRKVVRRLSTDSRTLKPGDLFIALTGDKFDGHRFVAKAMKEGAWGAMVQLSTRRKIVSALKAGEGQGHQSRAAVIGVEDTLRAYQNLAAYHRRRFDIPVVAITGSNGKTTTKEMVVKVLQEKWRVLKTQGNLNNSVGLPKTLLGLTVRHQVAVVELGVDREGQTARLCEIAQPTQGVITNIGPDHLEFFGSLDGSARAKAELLTYLPNDGVIVLNADDPYFGTLQKQARCGLISFGFSEHAQIRATRMVSERSRTGFRVHLPRRIQAYPMTVGVHGLHNIANALAAIAVGRIFGMSPAEIARGLTRFRPAAMRSHIRQVHGITVIQDYYNANPVSMKAAVDLLMERAGRKRTIAVLGDMLELGKATRRLHVEVGEYLARRSVSCLIACGDLGKDIAEGARRAGLPAAQVHAVKDTATASLVLRGLVQRGDVVLVKASRGMQLEKVFSGMPEWGVH